MDESNGEGRHYIYLDPNTGKTMERYINQLTGKMYIKPFGADATEWKETELVKPSDMIKIRFEKEYKVGDKEPVPSPGYNMEGAVILDPNDPFEKALLEIVRTNRRKRRDYALDGDPFSNFKDTSRAMGIDGFGPAESALFNVVQKLARLSSLRANGRLNDPANESVTDTYLDLAVYAIIMYAIVLSEGS